MLFNEQDDNLLLNDEEPLLQTLGDVLEDSKDGIKHGSILTVGNDHIKLLDMLDEPTPLNSEKINKEGVDKTPFTYSELMDKNELEKDIMLLSNEYDSPDAKRNSMEFDEQGHDGADTHQIDRLQVKHAPSNVDALQKSLSVIAD